MFQHLVAFIYSTENIKYDYHNSKGKGELMNTF